MTVASRMLPFARRQRGAVLLVMVLILAGAAGVLLTSRFEADAVQLAREAADRKALQRAKQALIDRAVLDANLPGSLPCPDNDDDGDADLLPCNGIGKLPWLTLDVPELRDHSGAHLWYAMSLNYMDRPASSPLNTDTEGQLTLDAVDDVVALVFAPGAPLGGQTLRSVNPTDVTQFLEGENANLDQIYTGVTNATRNDRVVSITAGEIMQGVQKRAMAVAEDLVRQHIANFAGFNNYIWLAPFVDPSVSNFMAVATTRRGHIPLHQMGENYTSNYTVAWSFLGPGVQLNPGPNTLTLPELQTNSQFIGGGSCANAGGPLDQFNCAPASVVQNAGLPPGVATRTFEFQLPSFFGEFGEEVTAPSGGQVGSRSVRVTNVIFAASPDWVIRVTDTDAGGNQVGGGTITFDNITAGDLAITGIHLAPLIDADDSDVGWYATNEWNGQLYMAIAPGYAPGAPNNCGAGCLTLQNTPAPVNDKPGLLLAAGTDLTGLRPSGSLSDYLEDENALPDDVFTLDFVGPAFNDAVRVLAVP